MKIGYVRVSKQEQHEALQIDALKEAGSEKWFLVRSLDLAAERKGLDEAKESGERRKVEPSAKELMIEIEARCRRASVRFWVPIA
jgi:DNA invertase Pin-like site-specific DNA recombinase